MSKMIKDILVASGCAFGLMWMVNYWFFSGKKHEHVMRSTASTITSALNEEQWLAIRPMKKTIDFISDKRLALPENSVVNARWCDAVMSTDGATLESFTFLDRSADDAAVETKSVKTVFGAGADEKHNQFFLVAGDKKTPFSYALRDQQYHHDGSVDLSYTVLFDNGIMLQKDLMVKKDAGRIDVGLKVNVTDPASVGQRLRLFFQSPIMPELGKSEQLALVVVDNNGLFVKQPRAQLEDARAWIAPRIFGAENRYMMHALVGDDNHFVERAYYDTASASDRVVLILEGPALTMGEHTWMLHFYLGPKEEALMRPYPGLENTLDYSGLLAPISRFFLYLLNWLYDYVHNYGFAIIILTILLKLLLLPLSWYNRKNDKAQREFKKRLAYIQSKYKHDAAALQREREQLIRTHGVPGLGTSLLQMIIQMPPFFALSRLLSSAFELYRAPWLWVPDLSAADPYYVLPAIVFVAMVVHATTVEAEQRVTFIIISVVATAIAANVSAGLALYIAVTALMGSVQQLFEKGYRKSA